MKEDNQTGEKEEYGEVEESRKQSDKGMHFPLLEISQAYMVDMCALPWISSPRRFELAQPLLSENGQQRGYQAEDEASEPQAIDPLVGVCRLEHDVGGSDVRRRHSRHLSALKLNKFGKEGDGDAGVVLLKSLRCLRDECC